MHSNEIKMEILKALYKEELYSYKLITELAISESKLYPILKELEEAEDIKSSKEKHDNRSRTIYKITNKGKERLSSQKGGHKNMKDENKFITYDYTTITVNRDMESAYIDTYESMGWELVDNELGIQMSVLGSSRLSFRRNRKINNKSELLKIQRKCEEAFANINKYELEKTRGAMMKSLGLGILGCVFLAISVFSFLGELWIIFSIAGAIGLGLWLPPYYVYRNTIIKDAERISPLIDGLHDRIGELCEEADALIKNN